MGLIAPSLPVVGQPNSSEEPKIVTFESQVLALVNGQLDALNLASGSGLYDRWETLVQLDFRGGIAGLSTTPCYVGGTGILTSGGAGGQAISGLWVPPTASDIAVTSKTTRLRVRVSYATNATAPGITLTWGLYPITVLAGGINNITPTLGTVISGSTAAVASPAANTPAEAKSGSFDLSAVTGGLGGFAMGVVGSGAQAGNSNLACTAYLEMRHS